MTVIETTSTYMLALDTSTSNMTLALLREGVLVAEHHTEAVRNHSVQLLPHIQQLLSGAGIRPKDLGSVAVGQGPGSYTGVRIGVTAAKTFAWSLGIPLFGVSSLKALALSGWRQYEQQSESRVSEAFGKVKATEAVEDVRWIIPLMDARRGQAFTGLYAKQGQGDPSSVIGLKSDGIRLMSAWVDELLQVWRELADPAGTKAVPREILFVGETDLFGQEIDRFVHDLAGHNHGQAIKVIAHSTSISAREVGELAYGRWQHGEQADDVYGFVPNYTQLAEAEAKLLQATKSAKD